MKSGKNHPNNPDKLLELFPDPTSFHFSKGFKSKTALKAEVILVKLCPLCTSTLFLTQIICRTCGTYVSKRERPSWYKHEVKKRSKQTLKASDLNQKVTSSAQVFADVGFSDDDEFWQEITILDILGPEIFSSKRLLAILLLFSIVSAIVVMIASICT